MGSIANQRAGEVFKASMGTFIAVDLVYVLINGLLNRINDEVDFFLVSILVSLILSIVSASSACFFFRAFNRGTPDTADTTDIFNMKDSLSKILAIVLVQFIINITTEFASSLFENMPLLNVVMLIGILFITTLFNAVWYLFVSNPQYQTADYFKASVKYMGQHLWGYIGFVLLHILIITLVAVIGIFLGIAGILFLLAFFMVYAPYLSLAIAGYISQIIPDEWYAGTAAF